jgi:Na+-transporting NADH:ubiquinone oxidoreductase subunit NqrB
VKSYAEETKAAFLLSLIGDVLILIGSFVILGLGILGAFGIGFMTYNPSSTPCMMDGFWTAGAVSTLTSTFCNSMIKI